MNSITDYDVIETSDNGQYRVILIQDVDCERPLDSGDWWIASVILTNVYGTHAEALYDPQERFSAWQHFNDSREPATPDADEAFKRYMSIFYGIKVFETTIHNGYRDTSNALAWLEPSEAERVGIPDTYPAKDVITSDIDQHNAWAEGDCYGYVVQRRVSWVRLDGDTPVFQNDDGSDGVREEWEDTDDSVWGFIGREYAEQEATEALAAAGRYLGEIKENKSARHAVDIEEEAGGMVSVDFSDGSVEVMRREDAPNI